MVRDKVPSAIFQMIPERKRLETILVANAMFVLKGHTCQLRLMT